MVNSNADAHDLPVGPPVSSSDPSPRPSRRVLRGTHVELRPVHPAEDTQALFDGAHGTAERERQWTYLGYGPFADASAMQSWLESCAASEDPQFMTVHSLDLGRPVGVVSFLCIVPEARRIEIGHIWYHVEVQRTAVNTETVLLLLTEAFESLGNRRVEWKCDALNERSRQAALRLGFEFEGVFRQHAIVKGRNRDTAWFSMMDHEWPERKAELQRRLDAGRHASKTARCVAPIAAALLLAAGVGCDSPLDAEFGDLVVEPARTHSIDEVRMETMSETDPVSVEAAAEESLRELVEYDEAPNTIDLDLAEVRAATLENNLDLKVQLFTPAQAAESLNAEEAKFESTFFGSIRRSETDSPTDVATEGTQSALTSGDLGVRVPLRTGGEVSVSLPMSRSETNNPFSLLDPSYQADVSFSFSQPLLRGGWIRTNAQSIRIAQRQLDISEARTKLEVIRILANADRAYWALYAAQQELIVRQKQYEVAITQLEDAEQKVAQGDTARIEITRAESGVAQSLEAIIITNTALRARERELKRLMNREDLPMSGATAITLTTDPAPMGLDIDPRRMTTYALENRMEMLELELQLAIDAATIELEENNALPLVTLDYSYAQSGLGPKMRRAYDQIIDRSFDDWTVSLRAEIPIGNEAAKARVREALLARLQRLSTKAAREQSIEAEVFDAVDLLDQAWQRILAARQESILAGRTYRGEVRQFDNGLRTSTDVLDAAANYADAQSREVRALADYQVALVDLAFATGTLLGKGRVDWAPAPLDEATAREGMTTP